MSREKDGAQAQCSPLHIVFVNGSFDSNPDFDPDQDQGFFGKVFSKISDRINSQAWQGPVSDASLIRPAQTREEVPNSISAARTPHVLSDTETTPLISRSYVNYPATVGGFFIPGDPQANPGSTTSYIESINIGLERAVEQLEDVATRCPKAKLGLMGYSQGAEITSAITKRIGAGLGPISADRLALSILFGNPTRAAAIPTQVLGNDAVGVGDVYQATKGLSSYRVAAGGGLSFDKTQIPNYGSVADRTVSWCLNGDIVCGLPFDSTLARALVGIVENVDLGDPIRTVERIAGYLSQALESSAPNSSSMRRDGVRSELSPPKHINSNERGDQDQSLVARPESNAGTNAASSQSHSPSSEKSVPPSYRGVRELESDATTINYNVCHARGGVGRSDESSALEENIPSSDDRLGNFSKALSDLSLTEGPSSLLREVLLNWESKGLKTSELFEVATKLSQCKSLSQHRNYDCQAVMNDGRTAVDVSADWAVATAVQAAGFRG
ncbi:cutinase family protein [Corynebacterium bovis]|uniref:cutinase family protein n=1 Tax=Corynebacterium bovis TaxID=36808 RepID=UPI0031387451